MPSIRRIAILLLALLVPLQPVSAQGYPTRVGSVATDSATLDAAAIDRAASVLADLGVEALALYVEAPIGGTLDDAERYFEGALARYGLAPDQSYIIIFVGTAPLTEEQVRPLFIELGGRLESRLGDPGFADVLRSGIVTPRLLSGDPTGAFIAAFVAIEQALTLATPSPNGPAASEPPPASEPLPPAERPRLAWELVLLVLLAGLAYLRFRRKRTASDPSDAATELRRIEGELSALLIDLSGRDPDLPSDRHLPRDPQQQTDFVLIRDFLAETDAARIEEIEQRYRDALAALERAEAEFEALRSEAGDAPAPGELLERYRGALADAEKAADFVAELSALWRELQSEANTVPQRSQALRSRIAGLRAALVERLPTTDPDSILARYDEALHAAEAQQDRSPLVAARTLSRAETGLERLESEVDQLADAAEGLSDMNEDLDAWQTAGFATDGWRRERDVQLQRVQRALQRLGDDSPEASEAVVAAADEARSFLSRTETQVALQRRNASRLEEARLQGERVRRRIEQGAEAFDAVDDFAEANWQDIRGNGTEAQKAAERAQLLVDRAAANNALAPDQEPETASRQDFAAAAAALDAAFAELDGAELLIGAIIERLETLREARATARRQLEAVVADLAAHQALLAQPQVDREVGEEPQRLLAQARRLAAEVESELTAERPDWLMVIARIQQADRLADEALAAIRNEREAMEHRRLRLVSERDEAVASRTRLENFVRLHQADLSPETRALARAAGSAFENAALLASRGDVAEEGELAELLESAAEAFDAAQEQADRAFEAAESEFSAAEALRVEAAAAVAAVEADIESFDRYLRRSGIHAEMLPQLRDLERSVPQVPTGGGSDRFVRIVRQAEALRSEIDRAMVAARRLAEQRESALRRERQRRLEAERRRRAAERARQGASWGGLPSMPPVSSGRPRVRRVPSISAPSSGKRVGGKSTAVRPSRSRGSWGGAKRSKGGW